jgi:hypothetical protein
MHIAQLDSQGLPIAIPGPPNSVLSKVLRQLYLARLVRMAYLRIQWWLDQTEQPTQIVEGLVEEDPDISAVTWKLMTALRNEVEDGGAELALFVVPSKYRLLHPVAADQQALEFSADGNDGLTTIRSIILWIWYHIFGDATVLTAPCFFCWIFISMLKVMEL